MADISFKVKGIEQALNLINRIAKEFLGSQERILDAMVSEGEHIAINRVGHIDTGETLNSIVGYRSGNQGFVVAGANAIWLEFGTGVRRNAVKHPAPVSTGGVTIYSHGSYGKGKGADPNGWYYPTSDIRYAKMDKDGNPYETQDGQYIAHTYGIPANFFMLNTAQELINTLPTIASKTIRIPKK